MRPNRHKSEQSTFYHLFNRVTGDPRYFPFAQPVVARKFVALFEFYLRVYSCRLASFQLMGNHFHSVVHFEQFRRLPQDELRCRARWRFGRRWRQKTRHWSESDWVQFNRNLFDVSRFMQHVENEFAKWFNRRTGRRGHFWADRFKNPELLDTQAIQTTILYTELNAVRAGMVQRPEDHKWSSAYWRWAGKKNDLLIPLEELFPAQGDRDSYATYRELLYHCGAVPTDGGQAAIPEWILRREARRGFARLGLFSRRWRFFTDGVAIGDHRPVARLLQSYRDRGLYQRRKHPIPQLGGSCFSLREQRSHAFSPG